MPLRERSYQTLHQLDVERCVAAAEPAMEGLGARDDDLVSECVRVAVAALAAGLQPSCHFRDRFVELPPSGIRVVGVPLWRGYAGGDRYRMVLQTRVAVSEVPPGGVPSTLRDGYDPAPLDHLDGFRLRASLPGLLRLLERDARALLESQDWNWGCDDDDPGWPPDAFEDESWHPTALLERARAMRKAARDALIVGRVQWS